jgi:hypothetical protein
MITQQGGIDSLLNEAKSDFKRGDTINYTLPNGQKGKGKYVMASSAEGYIVINTGGQYGTAKVISLDFIN